MWIYYFEDYEWQPWDDTIAYYPLDSINTVNDMKGSWTAYDLTNSWVAFWTYGWVDCAYFNGSSYMYRSNSLFTWSAEFTINLWYQRTSTTTSAQNIIAIWTANSTNSFILWLYDNTNIMYLWWRTNDRNTWYTPPLNTRINICITHKNWTIKVYINWNSTPVYTWTVSYWITATATNIWSWVQWASWLKMYGYMSKLIFESNERTEQQRTDYYNSTKSLYWIS